MANARRNAGFSATVSIRALIIRLPIEGSLAQNGTSPHFTTRSWRSRLRLVLGPRPARDALDDGVHLLGRRDVVVGGSRLGDVSGVASISNSSARSSGLRLEA